MGGMGAINISGELWVGGGRMGNTDAVVGFTSIRVWRSHASQLMAFRYFRQLMARYYVRRDGRNRANRSNVAIAPA